jgi:hypothetical protein
MKKKKKPKFLFKYLYMVQVGSQKIYKDVWISSFRVLLTTNPC